MKSELIAIIVQEGGKLISGLLGSRPVKPANKIQYRLPTSPSAQSEELNIISTESIEQPPKESVNEQKISQASSIEAGCVPCAIGHFGTCSGLLNEAIRFAKKDGIDSAEVIQRVNICLDELNAMERVDLRAELTLNLSPWEKELANKALVASRSTRHGLEDLTSVEDLERVTATTQKTRNEVGKAWFKQRLANMSPEEKTKVAEKAINKMEEE